MKFYLLCDCHSCAYELTELSVNFMIFCIFDIDVSHCDLPSFVDQSKIYIVIRNDGVIGELNTQL